MTDRYSDDQVTDERKRPHGVTSADETWAAHGLHAFEVEHERRHGHRVVVRVLAAEEDHAVRAVLGDHRDDTVRVNPHVVGGPTGIVASGGPLTPPASNFSPRNRALGAVMAVTPLTCDDVLARNA